MAQRFFNAAVEQALEECLEGVAFPPTATGATAEGQMLRADLVREMVRGGSGAKARDRSRVLDFLVKTPVHEIRAFDPDMFHVHNAFRSPGRLEEAELGKPKAEVYQSRYDNFRNAISVEPKLVDSSSM